MLTCRVTLLAVVLWAWGQHGQAQTITFAENFRLDLLFLIDGSRTVGESNFQLLLQAVLNLTETLPLGDNNVRVGVITYSTGVRVMNLTGNRTLLEETVPYLFYEGRDAHTSFALVEARTMMMTSLSVRPAVPKVVILITDSSSRYPAETRRAAGSLRALNVDVWAVGIGPYVRLLELIDITKDFSKVRLTNRFDVLPTMDLSIYSVVSSVSTAVIVTATATQGPTSATTATTTTDATGRDNSLTTTSALTTTKTNGPVIATTTTIISTQIQIIVTSTATRTDGLTTASTTATRTNGLTTASTTATRTDRLTTASTTATRTDRLTTASTTATRTDVARTTGVTLTTARATQEDISPSSTIPTATDNVMTRSVTISISGTIPTVVTSTKTTVLTTELQPSMTFTKSAGVGSTESLTVTAALSTSAIRSTNLPITPTSTEMTSSPPASSSSSVNVNDTAGSDQNDTDDTLGDGSVVFGRSDGVCSQAIAKGGFGFAPHPHDCDKFFQCHLSEKGKVVASVRLCPRGLHWDTDKMTCIEPELTCCRDRCKHGPDGQTYKMEGGCGLYWECQRGISWVMQCLPYHAYIPGKGCVFLPQCPHLDLSSGSCYGYGLCESRTVAEVQGYTIPVTGGVITSQCPLLTQFSIASCSCRSSAQLVKDCPWGVTILDPGQPSQTRVYDRKDMDNDENSGKYDVIHSLTINFRYKRSPGQSRHEVILRSRTCQHGGIFVVSEDFHSLHVRVLSHIGHTVTASVPLWGYKEKEWRTVNIQYSGGDLLVEVSEGSLLYTNYIQDDLPIPVGVCGWDVGSPADLMNHLHTFTGNMTKISISYCDVYGV